ncbi:SDR family NAD(P)-dependent oxidoreductase [Streptomyces diacarni]|uniref:SDR family NAD(P)-dependent oxidoreductase n=1 Tax=Streptomyces diacarni TaxID=2800381 RepID=A0A367EER7_9ACTN|nr:SDR family oxidoreductase [Streptomyces diacarni]RCG16259.1 SDR family NAD(P)-dependent oxidoreductase [Streptomyces diacarni]
MTTTTEDRPTSHPPLTGTSALVTGGSRGIGAAIARRLAADGADVALTYVSAEERAKEVAEDIRALGRRALAIRADSASPTEPVEAVHRTAREFGRLDILVNNAGIFPAGPLEELTPDTIDRALAVHVRAALLAAQAAAGHMRAGGRIVTIGSNLADRVPRSGITLYAASKSALNGLTKGLARDLGPRGITANLVHPGSTDTDMNPADSDRADGQRALTALGRYGTPEGIAATVAHLVHPDAGGTTGAAFTVDAGANA